MTTYAVSFDLKSDTTYDDRYKSLMAEIKKGTQRTWEDTTSFVLVDSAETLSGFESRIYINSSFDASKDKLLVMDVTGNSAIFRGKTTYPHTLSTLLPKVVQK
jgi:hypothetical protein